MRANGDWIAIYSRKSKFTGKGESIGNQVELCKEYVRNMFGEKYADRCVVFEDEGFSGGNLKRPELAEYETLDLLEDPWYLARNASITAHCALELALAKLPITLEKCPVLIVGWGRIGKCLAKLLHGLGACVTVAARKESRRVMIDALGYQSCAIEDIRTEKYRLIINTVPAMVLPAAPGTALKMDLASVPGIGGKDVMQARGLPGKLAPESSGTLIAQTITQWIKEK